MKEFMNILLISLLMSNMVWAFTVETQGWVDNPEVLNVSATEIELKSDLKNDYRVYQATLSNITNDSVDVFIPNNKVAHENVDKILASGMKFSELMQFPKDVAVNSYKEDVGKGTVAVAHKGLIFATATAGATAVGAGLLGFYPQQKAEEYFSHKKIKNEFKKISDKLTSEFTLAPLDEVDVLLFVPLEINSPIINTTSRNNENDVYSEYHQL